MKAGENTAGMPGSLDSLVAIIGMAGRFPMSPDLDQWWRNLREGVELVSFFSEEELASASGAVPRDRNYVRAAAIIGEDEVKLFDPSFFGYSPGEAELIDPQHRFFLECAYHALENSGYAAEILAGRVGVYASQTISGYWLNNIFSNTGLVQSLGGLQANAGSAYDFLATRVSYKLNLRGPSISVQTACSSSLVAVHLACQSLLCGECDMALAGGVSLTIPQKSGYSYTEGGILSPDGHCRVFDASAQGTIPGSGVGIVVLKRFLEAQEDGDNILAIIRGSAVNNDGSLKVGFTAPGVDGQSEVISEALAMAGVPAESISYVEAHGTGTALGDPVEISALTKAFGLAKAPAPDCAIGSVKSNMGHLDVAAGVAGLIKTVLQLQHKEIVPSLHFVSPNPKIDFRDSRFYVNSQLREWNSNGWPRRAGISSFGMGGTNAHVVLEEAPEVAACEPSRPWQLVSISTKTDSALDRATADFAEYLTRGAAALADIAYTSHIGRAAFTHRRAVVCQSNADGAHALRANDRERVWTGRDTSTRRPVVFLFPGQGSQYVGMGRELYQTEPTFRSEFDRCADALKPHLEGRDLREIIYATPDRAPEAERELTQTRVTQPALFAIEYSLARLWMEWGVGPSAMIGHSIGEYVAACLAGVMDLESALALVAARGRLMQGLAPGAMLAVEESEAKAELLAGELDLAVVNAPQLCVLSGSLEAVQTAEDEFRRRGIETRRLRTSHAFHSRMMDPILDPFTEQVRKVRLRPPSIAYVSNVTGTWILAEEATSPEYWARHLRERVRFADGVGELLQQRERLLLEVGPGQTLSRLARVHPAYERARPIFDSMRGAQDQRSDEQCLLSTLGRLWTTGAQVDWVGFHRYERRKRVALPPYSFERQSYWIEPPKNTLEATAATGPQRKNPDPARWFYAPSWRRLAPLLSGRRAAPAVWLLFEDGAGVGQAISRSLSEQGHEVVIVRSGESFERVDDSTFTLDPREPAGYASLIQQIKLAGKKPQYVVHLWSLTPGEPPSDGESRRKTMDTGFYSLMFLAQALATDTAQTSIRVVVVSNQVCEVTGAERLCTEKATIIGPCLVVPQEHQNISCRLLDIDDVPESRHKELADEIITEVIAGDEYSVIARRGTHRWTQAYEALNLPAVLPGAPALQHRGVYLITGGLGKIGLAISEFLAKSCQARLILVGRSALPGSSEWDEWLKTHSDADHIGAKIKKLKTIEGLGAEVMISNADVGDHQQMQRVLDEAIARFGILNGVIHGAGTLADADLRYLEEFDRDAAQRQFRAKIDGLLVLDELLRGHKLDFCVLLSSLAAVMGGLAFSAYSAANAFMDSFAQKHNRLGSTKWTSVNWDSWQFQETAAGMGAGLIALALTPKEGVEAFQRILASHASGQIIVSTADMPARLRRVAKGSVQEAEARNASASAHPRPSLQNHYVGPRNDVDRAVIRVWQKFLGIEEIGIHDNFFDLGGHSLMATQVFSRLREVLKTDLPLREFFEATTVAHLSDRIVAHEPSAGWTDKVMRVRAIVESMSADEVSSALQNRA